MKSKAFQLTILLLLIISNLNSQDLKSYLFPYPKQVDLNNGFLNQINGIQIGNGPIAKLIERIEALNITGNIKQYTSPLITNTLSISIDTTLTHLDEYFLSIDSTSIIIKGKSEAALFYAKQTLNQVFEYSSNNKIAVPCMIIKDWPDFERRGYMLDISRDKVPTMETLYHIIDLLASWKINEFQLYTEHTFAYKNHKVAWANSSPMTPDEIQKLDTYCKAKFIDLVPNQNSFGHMENWLKHDEYLHLANCPTDCNTIWGKRKRTSLNPINPGSLILMQELYSELLPNFSSQYFNIGCDETVELGSGLTKEVCEKEGKGTVYLNFIKKLNNEVNLHQKKAQFWGDIVLNHPELIPDIPKNMTALVWGYESTYPFEEKLPKFQEAGLDYYVCPGTSTWRSEIGRNHHAFINLKRAAEEGKKHKAKGYLNTNWGDWGHWQPLSVCYPTMAVGSAYSWNSSFNPTVQLEDILSQYILKDTTKNAAKAILQLGDAYLKSNIPEGNANAFHLMLRRYKWTMEGQFQTKKLNKNGLIEAQNTINQALELLKKAQIKSSDSTIIIKELDQAATLAKHGIKLGIARLEAPELATKNIDKITKTELAEELKELIYNHRLIWKYRNRSGGVESSTEKLQGLLDYYLNE